MSVTGTLIFYSTRKPAEPRETLRRLLEWSGATDYTAAKRTPEEDRSWEEFQAELSGSFDEDDDDGPAVVVGPAVPKGYLEEDFSPPEVTFSQLPGLFEEGGNLWIGLQKSPWLDRMRKAIETGIPPDIRGRHLPNDLSLQCGFHDIFECDQHEEGHYIARAFFAVHFFGYSTPSHGRKFEELFESLPEVAQLRRELRRILGPVGLFFEWSC